MLGRHQQCRRCLIHSTDNINRPELNRLEACSSAKWRSLTRPGNLYIGKKALRDAVFATKFDGISGTDRLRSVR